MKLTTKIYLALLIVLFNTSTVHMYEIWNPFWDKHGYTFICDDNCNFRDTHIFGFGEIFTPLYLIFIFSLLGMFIVTLVANWKTIENYINNLEE